MYFLSVTVAGIYNSSYPGTSQALIVCVWLQLQASCT